MTIDQTIAAMRAQAQRTEADAAEALRRRCGSSTPRGAVSWTPETSHAWPRATRSSISE